MRTGTTAALGAALLAGCTPATIQPDHEAAALAFVRLETGSATVRPITTWYANGEPVGNICGEIDAPEALRSARKTLRFMYFEGPGSARPFGTIEMHEGWVAGGPIGSAILVESRRVFDKTWESTCAPFAPWTRRIAAWFGGSTTAGDGAADTPLTNAAADDLLGRR